MSCSHHHVTGLVRACSGHPRRAEATACLIHDEARRRLDEARPGRLTQPRAPAGRDAI